MANTMYTPDSVLIRKDHADKSMMWESTDSEYAFNIRREQLDNRYTNTNVQYTYNSIGYRSREVSELNKDFMLCMGCSYTEGIGVDDADTWPARLETYSGMHTFNMGLGGSSTMINLINSTQWINNPKRYPLPRCVVVQIPEATRTPRVVLKGQLAYENNWDTSIEVQGTTPSNNPGQLADDMMFDKWRNYRNTFPLEVPDPYTVKSYSKDETDPDISPWFLTSALMTSLQTMWNAVGVPVLQMTYDDDGDIVYNPNNVFRITGAIQQDYGRDGSHQGPVTHQLLAEAIWPEIQELLEWEQGPGDETRPFLHARQKRDIVRPPYNKKHCTQREAMATYERLAAKTAGPFIYE